MGLNKAWLIAINSSRGYDQSLPELSDQVKRKAVWWPIAQCLCSGLNPPPKSSCSGWTGCPIAYCCQVMAGRRRVGSLELPRSPAFAGQCLGNQPCPHHCWRNSGFAFKERRQYQNYFNQNAKRFFIFPLLLSSYFQAVK